MEDIPTADESAPVGPSIEEEAAFLTGDGISGPADVTLRKINPMEGEGIEVPLPPMEDLVNRIPAPARELIENLFRARFITVKRMPKSALKGS